MKTDLKPFHRHRYTLYLASLVIKELMILVKCIDLSNSSLLDDSLQAEITHVQIISMHTDL